MFSKCSHEYFINKKTLIKSIYIPLWLYSNIPDARVKKLVNLIYIPLWLYSNW